MARGRSVTCELGVLETQTDVTGPVEVLVRPENLKISPAGADSPVRVRNILFFGHDQLVTVELASGLRLDARLGPAYHYAVGQQVQVRVDGPVMAYVMRNA